MKICEVIKKVLRSEGRTQTWIVKEMNKISPNLNMDRTKFSAIVCGTRRMTADELLIFCKATSQNPDIFLADEADKQETANDKNESVEEFKGIRYR